MIWAVRLRFVGTLLACVVLLLRASTAAADDIAFGADSLPHLVKNAQLIITADEPKRLQSDPAKSSLDDPTHARYALYSVKVSNVQKGSVDIGSEIRVAFPESLNVRKLEEMSNSILFLRPFADRDLKITNLPEDQLTYLVVSGRYGAVGASQANRAVAIRDYLAASAAGDEGVLRWTQTHVSSADPFIQRSAVVDLYFKRDLPKAIEQLTGVLKSVSVLPENKTTAINALQASGTVAAIQPLRDLAEDRLTPVSVRQSAVKAFSDLPGGKSVLQTWSSSSDKVLAPAAKSAIQKMDR